MLSRLDSIPCSSFRALIIAFLVTYYVHSATCFGSNQLPDSNDSEVDGSIEVATVGGTSSDENETGSATPEEDVDNTQNTSSDDPNSTGQNTIATNRGEGQTPEQSRHETLRRKLWLWLITKRMIAFYVVIGIAVIVLIGWFFLVRRGVVRTRLRVKASMLSDPELTRSENGKTIGEFLIIFNWSQKTLYLPTIIASLLAAILIYVLEPESTGWFSDDISDQTIRMLEMVGGIWFAVFFLNFLIEEYNVRLMVIITSLVSIGFLILWLYLSGLLKPFFQLFKHVDIFISWKGYLLVGLIGLLTVIISWIRGLFYFVAITPNYVNIQEGLTETGVQIARRDFRTSVDTTDLLERLLGFGKIRITFKASEREPMILYVWRIGAKAKRLEELGTKTIVT